MRSNRRRRNRRPRNPHARSRTCYARYSSAERRSRRRQRNKAHRQEGSMKTLMAFGALTLGAVIAFRYVPRESRGRLGDAVGRRIINRLDHVMASLPEGAPPKLVMSVLPRLQAQNEQIMSMLREQNELLRKQLRVA